MQRRLYTHKCLRTIGGMTRSGVNGRSRRKHFPSTTLSSTDPTDWPGSMLLLYAAHPTRLQCEALATDITILSGYVLFISEICIAFLLAPRHGATPGCGQRAVNTGRSTLA
jgi:hypothetical protein